MSNEKKYFNQEYIASFEPLPKQREFTESKKPINAGTINAKLNVFELTKEQKEHVEKLIKNHSFVAGSRAKKQLPLTVLIGKGKWLDNDGEIYDIHNIKLPFKPSGKHIAVYSKEEGFEDCVVDVSYEDGKILEFQIDSIEYW